MEGLAPPLKCLLIVRHELERGSSLSEALAHYLDRVDDEMSLQIKKWHLQRVQGGFIDLTQNLGPYPYRRALIYVFEKGMSGVPILNFLKELEVELYAICDEEIEKKIAQLPFLTMIPVLGLQFPAYLLLLLGPLLRAFMEGVQ